MLNRIWAPWRAQYVSRDPVEAASPSCFLCRALSESRDEENLIAWRGRSTVVILNRYPYNNGHLLVAPMRHMGTLEDFQGEELVEPIETIRWMIRILARMMRPQGFNVGLNQGKAAGAGLPGHLHWHVVPRWDGDANFMPVLAETRVVTESLDAFRSRLRTEIEADLTAGRRV